METARASRDSSWNVVLGCRGLGPMAPTGISSSPAPSSTAPGISADSPRPSPPRFIPCLPFETGSIDASRPHLPGKTPPHALPPDQRPVPARVPVPLVDRLAGPLTARLARPRPGRLCSAEPSLQALPEEPPRPQPSLYLQVRLPR